MTPDQDKALFAWIAALQKNTDWDSRDRREQNVLLVLRLEEEVANGGLSQFFVNPSGDRWAETLAALQAMDADRIGELFRRALTIFPEGQPSTDQLTRCQQYRHAGAAQKSLVELLTDEYHDLAIKYPDEDSYAKMYAYIFHDASICQNRERD